MRQGLLEYLRVHSLEEALWLAFGLAGQLVFALRFLYQWIASERRRESHIPVGFWYLSLVGAIMLLAYGLHRGELLLILGPIPGCVVYLRNLALIRRKEREAAGARGL